MDKVSIFAIEKRLPLSERKDRRRKWAIVKNIEGGLAIYPTRAQAHRVMAEAKTKFPNIDLRVRNTRGGL